MGNGQDGDKTTGKVGIRRDEDGLGSDCSHRIVDKTKQVWKRTSQGQDNGQIGIWVEVSSFFSHC